MDLEVLVAKFNEDEVPVEALLEYSEQIQNFFSGSPDPAKLEYYLGLAFHISKREGLLGFLFKKISVRQYDKVKEAVFHIIQYVISQKAWRSDASRFYSGFKDAADIYWKHSKETARLQQVALDCLICLFENCGKTLDLAGLDTKTLYTDLLTRSEKSAYQPTVRGKMFHLMGVLGYLGHDTFMKLNQWFGQLFKHTISTVTAQVESSDAKIEVSILHGCIKGLDHLLNVFDEEINVKDPAWIKFQGHLQKIVDPSLSIVKSDTKNVIKRREFQRAALELVANHGHLLQEGLFKKYQIWYEDLILWAKSNNADDNRIGRRTMNKFLDVVIVQYPNQFKHAADERQRKELDTLFKYFAEKFKNVLNTKNASRIELSVAVRGFGMLSNLCSEQKESLEMLNLIMHQVENILHELDSPVVDKYNSSISVLHTYLESVASILPSIKTEDTGNGIPEHYLECIKKLTILLIRFYPDLSESHRQYAHVSVLKTFDSLWKYHHLLCEPFIEQVYQQSLLHIVSCPTKAEIDILIESWNKSHPEGSKTKSAMSKLGLKSVKSYMQFWKLLLSRDQSDSHQLCFDLLMQWILDTIGKLDLTITFDDNETSDNNLDLVQSASARVVKDFQIFVNIVDFIHDLMSNEPVLHCKFQKWVVRFCYELLAYIKENVFVSGFYKILSVVFDAARSLQYFEQTNVEVQNLHEKLNIFFQGMGTKIQEFRDDLLFAVLELWLSLPDSLILTNIGALNNTLKAILQIGRTSFNLAIKGLDAIERWFFQKDFPVQQISIIMNNIFPILKTYFIVSENFALEEISAEEKGSKKDLKTLLKKNIQASKAKDDPTLKATQHKILHLIGLFGQFIQLEENSHSGLIKDTRFLLYTVPFQDCKPELYIDDLLPRVLELCENAVERQTRVSACEFFHTISLIFIGRSREASKEHLFRQIFHNILKLGCDSDIVVRQLFNPLCLQTVHWFSKRNSPYGLALLNVLTENLTQNEDMNRRELAALCFGEYLRWTLKHQISPSYDHQAKDIMKYIFAMGTHASATYRQGSVLAFNSIYRDFREETNLVSEFSFNLLFSFLTSLKLSKSMPRDSLLITSTKQAIRHLERILIKMKDRFNTALRRCFQPTAATTDKPCLKDVVTWLVSEGGSDAYHYRSECLSLVGALCPHVKNIATVEKCLTLIEETNGIDGWVEIAERNFDPQNNESKINSVAVLDAASAFYEFLFDHKMLSKHLFSNKSRSKFWERLLLLCSSSEDPCHLYSEEENLQLLDIFSRLKFAWSVLDEENVGKLWTYSMKLSKQLTGVTSLEVINKLVKVWCSGTFSSSAKTKCESLLMFEPITNITTLNDDKLIELFKQSVWYRDIAECGFLSRVLSKENVQQLRDKIWVTVSTSLFKEQASGSSGGVLWEAYNLSPKHRGLLENYLVIGLCVGLKEDLVVQAAFDPSGVAYRDGTFQLVSTKGQVFQKQLLNALIYAKAFFEFDVLLKEMAIRDVGDFIQRLLSLMKSNRLLRQLFGERVFQQTLANWKMISVNCDTSTSLKIFVGLLALNIDKCRMCEELADWWNTLLRAPYLDLRQKAEAFGYVTVFASSRKKKITEAVMNTILYVVKTSFKADQNWSDVEQHVTYMFRKMLKVFEQVPKDNGILEPILTTIVRLTQWMQNNPDHDLFRTARKSLEKVIASSCETDIDRVNLLSCIYKVITEEGNKDKQFTQTPSVWKCFLLPGIVALSMAATRNFFKRHIYNIIQQKMILRPSDMYEWMAKTISVNLLELLVYQTNAEFIKGRELADAYVNSASSEEEKTVLEKKPEEERIKIVYRGIVETCGRGVIKAYSIPKEDQEMRQCVLNCYQACFNTLAATLLVSKTDFKIFQGLIFASKMSLFGKLIDDHETYEFPVFIDETSHRLGVISKRGKIMKSASILQSYDSINFLPLGGNLSGSSLAPEATVYDFTTSVTVSNSKFYQEIFTSDDGNNSSHNNAGVDKLEWNEINKHDCMFAFVECLKEMHRFYQTNQEGVERKWPADLAKILKNEDVHNNVKIFIVGGIINTPESVEPFAAELVEPIIKLILAGCFGRIKLNHFVQDVLITLIAWNKSPGARPKNELVTQILKYVIEGLQNEEIVRRKDVLNHVLEIFQYIVRYWADGEENRDLIPASEIEQLGSNNPNDESSSLRLQVCLSVLTAEQLPSQNAGKLLKLFTKLAITSKYKSVYVTAAKCIGKLLHRIKEEAPQCLEEQLVPTVNKLDNERRTMKPSVFVEIVIAIQISFPEIMSRLRNCILELFQYPKLRSELLLLLPLLVKQQLVEARSNEEMLNMSPSSPNCIDEFFIDIDGRGLFNQACKGDDDLSASLDLFEVLIDNCSQPSNLLKMVDWQASAEMSGNAKIKANFAKCLEKLYHKILSPSLDSPMDFSTKQSFLKIFIRMYSDENEEVREMVNRFWIRVLGQWGQSTDLMLELFDLIGQEEHPLNVFLGLILHRCCLSPDYSKSLFSEPLENCQFVPFQLDTSWRLQHSSFQPLFAESLSSVKNFGTLPRAIQSSLFSQRMSVGKFGMNVLRATLANLQFTPTQQNAPNDSMDDFRMEVDQQSFHFDSSKARPAPRMRNGDDNHDNTPGTEDGSLGSNPILKLRKKFYARKDSTFYATRESEVRMERVEQARELVRSRVSGVKTVRKYRIGELPDILICNSDVLNTLVKLAKQDENLGRQFLRLLFQSMIGWLSLSKQEGKFLSKAKDIFERVFRNILASPDRSLSTLLIELSTINSISIQTSMILEISKACNLQTLGILKLEDTLVNEPDSSSKSSKRSRQTFQGDEVECLWLGLAELYKEIEEYDVIRNIFANVEFATNSDSRKKMYNEIGNASHLESTGHLQQAVEILDSVLSASSDEDISLTGKQFLEDSLMNCVAKLGEWDTLYQLTTKFTPALSDDVFQNPQFVQRVMPMQMLSGMQLTLRHDDDVENENVAENYNEFHNFLKAKLETEVGTSFLTSMHPFEIGVWLLTENENEFAPQANLMLERGYENIIRQLKNVESVPLKVQKQNLLLLEQSSVLFDYGKWRKQRANLSALESPTRQLLANWGKLLKHQPLDMMGSYIITSYRDCFLSKIGLRLQDLQACEDLLMSIQQLRVDQDVWLANLGAFHKSFPVSRNCLTRLKVTGRDEIRPVEFRKSLAKSLAVFPHMFEQGDWRKRWCSVWKKLEKVNQYDVNVTSIKVDLLNSLTESVKSGTADKATHSAYLRALNGGSGTSLVSCLLSTAQSLIPDSSVDAVCNENSSLFCKLFSLLKNLTGVIGSVSGDVAETMLSCILRGCGEQGESNEMLLLSNIFSMLKQFPNLNQTFESLVQNVPSFLFLPWIDQIITAYKNFPNEYPCFKGLINRLVKDFPRAFQLQYPEYLDKHCQLFGKALKAVVLPHRLHENMLLDIVGEKNEEKRISLLSKFQTILQDIINSNNLYGEHHVNYANEMFEIVNRVLAEAPKLSQGTTASSISEGELSSQFWNEAKTEMNRIHENYKGKDKRHRVISLEKLSPFLSNFHFFEHAPFEKPGLYEHFRRPNVQDHPSIVSFHPTVQSYISLTLPIKLTIITNDGRRSNFLTKLGDDLRQDRRIQQMFKMSDVLFQKDASLKSRNLTLDTYSVIPITSDFGLIEMVDDVMSLLEVTFDTPVLKETRSSLQLHYNNWMRENWDPDDPARKTDSLFHYRSSGRRVGRQKAEAFYTKLVEALPKYLLSDNIKRRCRNQMEFFCIRQIMIKSYGALCMVHWLLGIGDRHLDNCLLSMNTGKLVGIDFGRAFGTSNYITPIPEMIPFRLTPQLQHLMLPHSYKGLFRESCIRTWNCMVDNSEVILTVANVFIQEPSMDWLKLRLGSKSCQEELKDQEEGVPAVTATASPNQTYFPFEIMKRKLLGHNPTNLLLDELKMHSTKEIIPIYCRIVEDGRILRQSDTVSNEQLVDILLDLATDKNILIRLYAGWNPWV